ncbi:ADP-ribosylglycohydrolase family protein [Saccharomonospora glauca]|uniref:ADP-ribosylglycohydrolase n=1 Tax=Saccharomonospora glauca K62 TaxID=928724 RepID=I1D4L8_9PSEU|nr:ADP-ribosylglycohydrolase family protein [Saccharomonospora glauca]EIE99892.1 ADP-ribosylglycohydrolase [Saccharomonospora glauca K62]
MIDTDSARGCLLAGAAGDALGAPVEFRSWQHIERDFGPRGITDYTARGGYGLGAITDDTQMTLFTLEGLLRARERGTDPVEEVRLAYLDWYATQGGGVARRSGELVHDERLHARRAPGLTCLSALGKIAAGQQEVNDSKGCGGVMRVAPVALVAEPEASDREVFTLAGNLARLTHQHPSGYLSAGAFAVMVRALVASASVEEAVEAGLAALREVASEGDRGETERAVRAAVSLARTGVPEPEVIEQRLGGGWTGESALAIAVCAALCAPDLREGVRVAVNHSGDSDSTGSLTGNLLGARYGAEAIPPEWLGPLECRDLIEKLAERI